MCGKVLKVGEVAAMHDGVVLGVAVFGRRCVMMGSHDPALVSPRTLHCTQNNTQTHKPRTMPAQGLTQNIA